MEHLRAASHHAGGLFSLYAPFLGVYTHKNATQLSWGKNEITLQASLWWVAESLKKTLKPQHYTYFNSRSCPVESNLESSFSQQFTASFPKCLHVILPTMHWEVSKATPTVNKHDSCCRELSPTSVSNVSHFYTGCVTVKVKTMLKTVQ